MLFSLCVQIQPGSDLGFLLHKHPERVFRKHLSVGEAWVFYPECQEQSATVALHLEVDPVALVRRQGADQYVNDRPYVASSLMSVALGECFATAMRGNCTQKPELASQIWPLKASLSLMAVRGGESLLRAIFTPLGYTLELERLPLDVQFPEWGDSAYFRVHLSAEMRIADLLNHLYVLLPVLDRYKHYYLDRTEVDKLLYKGQGWLESHPERELIIRRYLQERPSLVREALGRLVPEESFDRLHVDREASLEKSLSLNQQRIDAVVAQVNALAPRSLVEVGCGEGRILKALVAETRVPRLIGVDISPTELAKAERRLKLKSLSETAASRLQLLQGSALYRDIRWADLDLCLLIEVIEHLEPFQLSRLAKTIFDAQRPRAVLITTPNREYNVCFDMPENQLRHGDHRFEWTRSEFQSWCSTIAEDFAYHAQYRDIGEPHPEYGPPTQMVLFTKERSDA